MTADLVSLEWLRLAPALAPALGALLVLTLDAFVPGRRVPHLLVAVVALLGGAAAAVPGALGTADDPVISLCLPGGPDGACLWSAGPIASTLQIGVLAATLAVVLLMTDVWRSAGAPGATSAHEPAVDVALLLGSATGGVAVAATRELGTWLVALELATLPVVGLVALRGTRRAAHGALSLIMTSLLSFAVLVVGTGLWLLATGDPTLNPVAVDAAWQDPTTRPVILLAALTLVAGVAFKLSAIPFHAWTPPTFTSAPLPITALLASASKIAALAALVVVLTPFVQLADLTALPGDLPGPHALAFGLGAIAITSMLVGTMVALRAPDAVRLLTWSTIAQAGWVFFPLAAVSATGHRAAAGYVLTYAAASLVAFTAVMAVRAHHGGEPAGVRDLAAYRGLARTHPHVGAPLVLALLVLAGLPPGVLGLIAKVVAFRPVLEVGLWPLAAAAVLAVVLGIAVYLRWVAIMLKDPIADPGTAAGDEPAGPAREIHLGRGAMVVLAIGSALLVVASVVPHVLYGLLS